MLSFRYLVIFCIMAAVLVGGCTSSTAGVDPLAGSWTFQSMYNGSVVASTLVFGPDGNFNGFMLGLLGASGHWSKINATAYNAYYGNSTMLLIMNDDRTQIWDSIAPDEKFYKQ
jgi:hypothetical protein